MVREVEPVTRRVAGTEAAVDMEAGMAVFAEALMVVVALRCSLQAHHIVSCRLAGSSLSKLAL